MKILDFRGGDSCSFFSRMSSIINITKLNGVESFVEKSYNDYKAVNTLLKNVVKIMTLNQLERQCRNN